MKPKYLIAVLSVALAALLGFLAASCGTGEGAESAGPVPSEPTDLGTTSGTAILDPRWRDRLDDGDGAAARLEGSRHVPGLVHGRARCFTSSSGPRGATPRVGTAALEALFEGPGFLRGRTRVGTAVPQGTQLLGLAIDDGIASVDLTSEFESGADPCP